MKDIPARLILTFLAFFGNINMFTTRVNLSVAMVAMVRKHSPLNENNLTINTCPELVVFKNVSHIYDTSIFDGEFDWDAEIQGRILGSFFYGTLLTQIPSGVLAQKYGAKWVYGFGVFIPSLLSLLTPVAARWNVWALVAVRVMEGIASGLTLPSMNVLIAKWIPKLERTRVTAILFNGFNIGILATNSVAGLLCNSSFFGGWPSVFYICGSLGCLWFILWAVLVYESPEVHPRISKRELNYIQERIDKISIENAKIPWKAIWTSLPMWSIIVAHLGQMWAFYTVLTLLPTYLANILHFDLQSNGMLSGLPFLVTAIFALPFSVAADKIRGSGRLRITTIRKIFNSIGFFGQGLCVVAIAFTGCYPVAIIVLFSVSFALNSAIFSGVFCNHVDMSPRFAGTLFGITNTIATLPGFIAPALAGWILNDGQTLKSWGHVFITVSTIYFITGLFYAIFASAELQPWNESEQVSAAKMKTFSFQEDA